VLDSGTTERGASYLVMELLEGESLSARIKRLSRLDERSAIEIAMQTASGLGAAHAKGIIHRDLKPDNLFIIPEESDAARERVKILDFGIAKLHAMAGDSLKTRTGTLMGTPIYMSPEQCLGTKEVDHRSDVYSLGIIIYEMLAGRPPFVSEGFGELLSMHLHEKPPSLREFAPQVTAEVEFAVLRMLAKKPDDRYQSMADVRAALAAAAGLPHPVVPEHKLGSTDQFGVRATLAAHAAEQAVRPCRPPRSRPAGWRADAIPDVTLKMRRKPWALPRDSRGTDRGRGDGIRVSCARARGRRRPFRRTPREKRRHPKRNPSHPKAPLVGAHAPRQHAARCARRARLRRGGAGNHAGNHRAAPIERALPLRFEKEGFVAAMREASLAADSSLSVVLEAAEKTAPTPKKHTPGKSHSSAGTNEPAKL
jgi:hypothetical protein